MKINSVLIAKVTTAKPSLTRSLPKQLSEICDRAGVSESEVRAPSTPVIKSDLIKEAFKIVNGMVPFLRGGKVGVTGAELAQGLAVCTIKGAAYNKSADVATIQAEFDARRSLLDNLLRQIGGQFDALIETRMAEIKGLAAEVELPSKEEFLADFTFEISFSSLDQGVTDDILGQVSKEVADRLRANNAKVQDGFRQAHKQPVEDCIHTLTESLDKLLSYGVKGSRFRQEPIDKIVAAATSLREQNWLDLPDLTKLASKLESLKADREDVVASEETRKATAVKWFEAKDEASSILAGFGI